MIFFCIVIPLCLLINVCIYCYCENNLQKINIWVFICHLLHGSAVFSHHQIFTATYMKKNTVVGASSLHPSPYSYNNCEEKDDGQNCRNML